MTPEEQAIENALATMPMCKKPILMSECGRHLLHEQPDWILGLGTNTGCVPIDFNPHPRDGSGVAWIQNDIREACDIADEVEQKTGHEITRFVEYSPWLGDNRPLDPMEVDLGLLLRFAELGGILNSLAIKGPVITNIDSEHFRCERDENNVLLDTPHNAWITAIHKMFHDVAMEWSDAVWFYQAHSVLWPLTGEEPSDNVGGESYRVFEPDFWHKSFEVREKRAEALGKTLVWHVSCGAGWKRNDVDRLVWDDQLDYPTQTSYATGKFLGDRNVQMVVHPHIGNTTSCKNGGEHLSALIHGVNDAVGGVV